MHKAVFVEFQWFNLYNDNWWIKLDGDSYGSGPETKKKDLRLRHDTQLSIQFKFKSRYDLIQWIEYRFIWSRPSHKCDLPSCAKWRLLIGLFFFILSYREEVAYQCIRGDTENCHFVPAIWRTNWSGFEFIRQVAWTYLVTVQHFRIKLRTSHEGNGRCDLSPRPVLSTSRLASTALNYSHAVPHEQTVSMSRV